MEKRTREILALVMLVVLALAVAFAMGWYILIGHNWNIAAVHIDDYVGEMRGYTVIVYEGVEPSPVDVASFIDADAEGERNAVADDSEDSIESELKGSDVDAIIEDYRNKEANVLHIRTKDPSYYSEPLILKCGEQRFGVFSVKGLNQYGKILMNTIYLARHSVDRIIIISEDRALQAIKLNGIDLVIFACDTTIDHQGEYIGNVFYVDCPPADEEQVVIIAPNNMFTSKIIAAD